MTMTIITGHHVPQYKGRRKYPFRKMKVGDYLSVKDDQWASQVFNAAYRWGSAHGRNFSIKRVDGNVQIWRVK